MFHHFIPPFNISIIGRFTVKYAGIPPDRKENNKAKGNTLMKIMVQFNLGNNIICPSILFENTIQSIPRHTGTVNRIPKTVPVITSKRFSTRINKKDVLLLAPNARLSPISLVCTLVLAILNKTIFKTGTTKSIKIITPTPERNKSPPYIFRINCFSVLICFTETLLSIL